MVARLRKKLFDSIIAQDIAMFDVTRTGELVNRLSADTAVIKSAGESRDCVVGVRFVV